MRVSTGHSAIAPTTNASGRRPPATRSSSPPCATRSPAIDARVDGRRHVEARAGQRGAGAAIAAAIGTGGGGAGGAAAIDAGSIVSATNTAATRARCVQSRASSRYSRTRPPTTT